MKYYEQALKQIHHIHDYASPSVREITQLTRYDMTNATKAIMFLHIQILILIYFNDIKTAPDKAFSKDIDLIRETIAEHQDYLKNSKNFSDKIIAEIYVKYIKKGNFNIPYLNKTIKDNEFIDLFDRMHKSIYKCQTIMREMIDKDDMEKEVNELEDISETEKTAILHKYKRGRYANPRKIIKLNNTELSR